MKGGYFMRRNLDFFNLFPEIDLFFDGLNLKEKNFDETKSHYLLNVDVPGFKKEDISVEFLNGTLIVSGKKDVFNGSSKQSRSVKKSFPLNFDVDSSKIEAKVEDGILYLAIPKGNNSSTKIEIKNDDDFWSKLIS